VEEGNRGGAGALSTRAAGALVALARLSTVTNCNPGSRMDVAAASRVINCDVATACPDDFFHELFACQGGLMEAPAEAKGPNTLRAHLNAARGTHVQARERASLGDASASSRRIVEFPRWEFNFQMHRAPLSFESA